MTARAGLEPAAFNAHYEADMQPTEREIALSQAISLKRIADALWGTRESAGLLQLLNPLNVQNHH